MLAILPRERRPKPRLTLPPESSQRNDPNPPRILLEGGGELGLFRTEYCYISWHQCKCRVAQSVLEHRLGATSVATFITKRAALVRSQRSVRSFCGRRLWRGPSAAEVASLGCYWGAACDAGYGHRRIHLLRGCVNRVASDALRAYDKPLIHNLVL
jgi:hypothetical protein